MAESNLSIGYDAAVIEVGQFMGFGGAPTGSGADDDLAITEKIINRGYMQFLNPPVLPGESVQHRWSFLRPTATITTQAPYSTGTIDYDHADSTNFEITLTSGTWPSWAADGSITITGTTYAIATRTSDSIIVLADGDNPGADIASGTSYSLSRQNMDLPDSFGAIEGGLTYQGNAGKHTIEVIGVQALLELRQRQSVPVSWPRWAAIQPLDATATAGQRFEILLYPTPDAAYILTYQYLYQVEPITATNDIPLGGMMHGRTILASIMAEAERKLEPAVQSFRLYDLFIEQLRSSIALDRTANSAKVFGYNADNSDREQITRRPRDYGVAHASVNGVP